MNAVLFLSESGGGEVTMTWLLWLLLAVFFVVSFIGYWVSKNHPPEETEETPGMPSHHEEAHQEAVADDLKKIEGIGPKVAEHLNKMGITTFAQLAEADPQKVQAMLNEAGLQMMNPEGWIMQAKLAAKGDWEGLAKLQDELKGGRVQS
jgi:predicted flap endonuclease-1-like 5' DNA nuclease